MACPYFRPVQPRGQTDPSRSAMLPLGDAWDGVCAAISDVPYQPEESTLLHCCNLGYARGCCERFPASDGPDAVRFTISGEDQSGLQLYYVLERNHHPWAHGRLELARGAARFLPTSTGEPDLALVSAYADSYRRRMAEASHH